MITTASTSVALSAQVHASLLDAFIRLAQEKRDAQTDAYTADSLSELIASLQDSRDEYHALAAAPALATAA